MNQAKQTLTATITPKWINDPKPGKRNYWVKDTSGAGWSVPPAEAQKMVANQPCVVSYTIFQGQGGHSTNMVERVDVVQGTVAPPQQVGAAAPPLPQHTNGDTPPILSNALGHYLSNPNCSFVFASAEEFGQFVRRVQDGYTRGADLGGDYVP